MIKLVLIVGIGAGIGWITNYVAIKMLFRPYKEINFGLFKIQGLLPKRKHEIGESIAEIIQSELVSLKDIVSSMDKDKLEEKMSEAIDKILEEKLQREITKNFPMIAMFLSSDMLDKIKVIIKNSILENKDKIISMFSDYLEENVDFKGIIVRNVDAFSLEKLEEITYSLAKKEFKHIEVVGAVLGAIIGFAQFIIGMIM
ncbi:DUF445 domain-containing protein [Fusobacterium mortiferum]|uniref:DUF445 family protein n=2 Tax=Fusobacterium TaxID=848 RepID=A0ABS2G0P5_FUSMR|nr:MULTISPECIES: DUF445 family protein [Fusobacterium]MBU3841490.1 DUF445 family protein [Candidatus Fusobacterium pullicola]MBM6689763.1 DUF445 family protein [Fusobacterium mortiferum]MBM6821091.1 DUF445 family protein [Fusobacterium mortiferum]MBM6874986.1 DUF445 family protein [Fusobacterium mortiferum]MDO5789500.1 DUF445 family protein [Fusobacterium sp.]